MAGRGPTPKPDASRRRRNPATTASVLPSQKEMTARFRGRRGTHLAARLRLPPRPDGQEWLQQSLDWWQEVVHSPMATRYVDADRHGLYMAFALIDEFYRELASTPSKGRAGRLAQLAVEVRQQIARYGLTPRDRLSLHWGIADDEEEDQPRGGGQGPSNLSDFRSALGTEESA